LASTLGLNSTVSIEKERVVIERVTPHKTVKCQFRLETAFRSEISTHGKFTKRFDVKEAVLREGSKNQREKK